MKRGDIREDGFVFIGYEKRVTHPATKSELVLALEGCLKYLPKGKLKTVSDLIEKEKNGLIIYREKWLSSESFQNVQIKRKLLIK
jgi:hypothetical protein